METTYTKISEVEFKEVIPQVVEKVYNLDELVKTKQDRLDYLASITNDVTNEIASIDALINKANTFSLKSMAEVKLQEDILLQEEILEL